MNATEVEAPDRVDVEGQAKSVMAVLREYAGKFAGLTAELLEVVEAPAGKLSRAAWLLDQSELIKKPFLLMLSRGSGLRENSPLEPITRDELSLRMFEAEVHLHHMTRLTNQLHEKLVHLKWYDQVAKLRVVAGLPGGKNGSPFVPGPRVNP